jgi:hypothetical protein
MSVSAVIVVGASGSGKSTLVAAVRAAAIPGVDVPRRFVTRPARPGDRDESEHLTADEFDRRVAAGEIGLHWTRPFEGERVERYGFAPPARDALAVYSANDALVAAGARPGWIVVSIRAPREMREARLRLRAWTPSPGELAHRLAEAPPPAHVVIENHGPFEAGAPAELVALVRRLVS